MQYMLLIYTPENGRARTDEEWAEMMPAYMAYSAALRSSGAFVDGSGLAETISATTVRVRDGKRAITDGPFAETKEYLGGYFVVECTTLDAAIELAAACPGALDGSVEVRPLLTPPSQDAG